VAGGPFFCPKTHAPFQVPRRLPCRREPRRDPAYRDPVVAATLMRPCFSGRRPGFFTRLPNGCPTATLPNHAPIFVLPRRMPVKLPRVYFRVPRGGKLSQPLCSSMGIGVGPFIFLHQGPRIHLTKIRGHYGSGQKNAVSGGKPPIFDAHRPLKSLYRRHLGTMSPGAGFIGKKSPRPLKPLKPFTECPLELLAPHLGRTLPYGPIEHPHHQSAEPSFSSHYGLPLPQ